LQYSAANKRNFTETIDLQVSLKNYDVAKDKPIRGSIRLPVIPRPKYSVCMLADAKHEAECKALNIPFRTEDDLKKMGKQKKAIKQLAQAYDAFLASDSLIKKIPRLIGPGLNKAGKFPTPVKASEKLQARIDDIKASAKFQLKNKKSLCMGVAVGNVTMTPDEIANQITLAVNYLVGLLPKTWQQIRRIYVKSTMGPSKAIFG